MDRVVKAKLLTSENFSKYGYIIDKPSRSSDVAREYLDYWHGLYNPGPEADVTLGYLEIRRQAFEITALERHVTGAEIFIPVEGVSIMPFAPASDMDDPDAVPDSNNFEAFIVDGTKGMVINKGVWHFPPLPITERMGFIVTVPKEVSKDLDIKIVNKTGIVL